MFRAPLLCLATASCTLANPLPGNDDDGAASGPLALLSSDPAEDAVGVPLSPSIVLRFDGFPDPASVASFGPVTLRSGVTSFDYELRVDLVERAIVLRPRSPLQQDTSYAVHVRKSVRSLDGRGPASDLFLRFRTGTTPGTTGSGRPRVGLARVQESFIASCAFGGCHSAASRAGALDLSSAGASAAALVGVPATEARLARVAPGDPAASYLLRKLLGTPDIQRERMPLLGGPWPEAEIHLVSDWIASGASH